MTQCLLGEVDQHDAVIAAIQAAKHLVLMHSLFSIHHYCQMQPYLRWKFGSTQTMVFTQSRKTIIWLGCHDCLFCVSALCHSHMKVIYATLFCSSLLASGRTLTMPQLPPVGHARLPDAYDKALTFTHREYAFLISETLWSTACS